MDRDEFYSSLSEAKDYIAHSQGAWKKHKYISKVFKAGKWIYKHPITGKGYLEDAENDYRRGEQHGRIANKYYNNRNAAYGTRGIQLLKSAEADAQAQKAYESAEKNFDSYTNKSVAGLLKKYSPSPKHKAFMSKVASSSLSANLMANAHETDVIVSRKQAFYRNGDFDASNRAVKNAAAKARAEKADVRSRRRGTQVKWKNAGESREHALERGATDLQRYRAREQAAADRKRLRLDRK